MYIKELVLENFKSFGRKTRIPFYQDFTVITGPNGSGKSNIIDSILFALGLARTSGIRAEKLTDLIYNPGHADEAAEGAGEREASVEVIMDNAERTVSRSEVATAMGTEDVGDVDEIAIKRRVKETEENYYSYYYINGRSVNLGDIRELLASAGVTPEGYNVVMQGDVTEIINMTPRARREIIDEIAGVAEFDAKKDDAFAELELVEDRIGEAELRIEEKETRLARLEDERETALEYRDLREQKEEYESYRKAAELEDKREELTDRQGAIEAFEETLQDLQAELDERQGAVVRLEDDLADLNAEIERKGEDEQLEIKREIEGIKGEIARLEDKIASQQETVEDAENERRQAFVQIDRKQETVEDLETELRETKVAKSNVTAQIQERETELEEVEARIESVGAEFEEVKEAIEERRGALTEQKERKHDLQREQDRLLDEARRRSNEQREKREALSGANERIPELEDALADLEAELEKARQNRETIEAVLEDLKAERGEYQDRLADIEDDLTAAQQEYAELEAQADKNGDSGYGRAVTKILNADLDGVHGTVGGLGGVDAEYATACETAAGGRLANTVVDDDAMGKRCIEYLKSHNAGRATFLPLTEMYDRSLPSLPDHDGVVDFAYNLVEFEPEYAGVFSYVLGDTVVVEDIDTAREFMGEYRLVTLDGDLVEKSGAMTGGSSQGTRYSFSGGKSQLERLAERINDLEDEREAVRAEIRDVEGRLEDAREKRSEATEQVRELEADIERTETEIDGADERIEELEAELEEITEEREAVVEEMDELDAEIARADEEIDEIEADIDELEAEVADSELPELTDRAEALEDEITDLEDRLDDLDGDLNELQLEKQYAEEAIEDLHDDIEDAQNRKAGAKERIAGLRDRIEDEEDKKAEKEAAVAELEAELSDLKEDRTALREELQAAKQSRDEQQAAVSEVERDLESAEEECERLEWEIDELEAQVGDYDPEEVPDHEEVEDELDRLEGEMTALEPVNMRAIDAYDEVQEDLADLQDKRATLVEEAEGIRDRIATYEQKKKATFMDAYEAIDEHFRDIFERLSNGTGRLYLENEEDPFDGGLTMKAQPGDKPIQRLNAMSGGEKSLTALAFIFAIQRHNPAPFYALDEIDAFLDAKNADLVGEMVDELAGEAQFVVVSHRSALLDRSERAIGVTMQDENVSAVTGIELSAGEDVEVAADD